MRARGLQCATYGHTKIGASSAAATRPSTFRAVTWPSCESRRPSPLPMAHVTRSFPASRAAFDPPHLLNTAPAAGRGESSSRTRKPCSCDSMDSMDSLLWGLWTGLMKKSAPYAMRSSFATYNKALHGPARPRGRSRTAARFAPSLHVRPLPVALAIRVRLRM